MRYAGLMTGALLVVIAGCDNGTGPAALESDGALLTSAPLVCQAAGSTGLTAVHVNQSVIGATIDFADHSCDMAIFFDAGAPSGAEVRDTEIIQTTGAGGVTVGVWNDGGDVAVTQSVFTTDVAGQYIAIRYENGATGTISGNELTGTHRVGLLIRGGSTVASVSNNRVTGSGLKSSGWAENGIQIDQGASATLTGNTVEGHWWDGTNWASTAIMVWQAGVNARNNVLIDNEFSIYAYQSDSNRYTGNRISSEIVSTSRAWGLLMLGSDNRVVGNDITGVNGAAGIYIFPGSGSNRFAGNKIDGFQWPIYDGGDDTVIRGKPTPVF